MWFIPSLQNPEPRPVVASPREKRREPWARRTFLRTAALPQARGPGCPGARTDSSLSRFATSPLRRASRHLFVVRVSQRTALPHGRVFTDVPDPLGSRARFRALCRTPRFFEPRCRRTNSANLTSRRTGILIEQLPSPASTGVDTFLPKHRSPEGADASHGIPLGVAPRHRDVGARAPEANPGGMAMNSHGPGDPSEGPAETGSPPQAPPGRPGHHLDLRLRVEPSTSCIGTALDPRRTVPREGYGCS